MAIVTVKNKYQVVIPQSVREQMDVNVGDLFEAMVEKGKITLAPKSIVDRAIAEGLADIKAGRMSGPFDSVEDMLVSLKGKKAKPVRATSRTR
ncbi:MAG: AbrB/MazE/SpoVT family DNA-binding domain-containing protein [Candidatus Liptonbacteria bacterium]|nr:AbrB/MazE/SpoVT family DNA-binding domain-containing protein [Candidatus Liptonbacteria bacterium]